MFQLRQILFPVDFSIRCRGAAAYVQALAGRFDAELILLNVVEATYNSTLADLHEARMEKFDSFFDKSLRHLRVRKLVAHGEAAQKIIECASVNHADLIMIPTQGMGIYRRLILGSTSAKVLHDADCPVWTGVHLEKAPPLEAVACQRILCAVDLKPSNAGVARSRKSASAAIAARSVFPSASAFSILRALRPSRSDTKLESLMCICSNKLSS